MHISAVLSKPLASRPPLLRCPTALPAQAWQRRQLGVAAVKGGGGRGSAAGSGRRVKLVKRREKLPGGQRNRPKYQDEPRKLEVRPDSPEFSGRLLSEINAANGPRQLLSLVQQFGPHLPAGQVAAVLSRLAGFVGGGGLEKEQEAAAAACGPKCVLLLQRRLDEAEPLTLSRAVYSLYRLKVYDQALMAAVVARSLPQLPLFKPDALSGLVLALGASGHSPVPPLWLDRCCLEVYMRFGRYSAVDIANLSYGLVKLGHRPSDAWREAAQRHFRDAVSLTGTTPLALTRFGYALGVWEAAPSFNWVLAYCGEARRTLTQFTPRELATLAWTLHRFGHPPDPLLIEGWYKVATLRMTTLPASSLVLALTSLAAMKPEGAGGGATPPGKFTLAALARAQAVLRELSAEELGQLLWALTSLRVRPQEEWMDDYMAALESSPHLPSPPVLCDLMWAFARLRYQPGEGWTRRVVDQLSSQVGSLTAPQLGMLVWCWRSVELPPPSSWVEAFRDKAATTYTEEQLQDIDQLLAAIVQGAADNPGQVVDGQQQQQQQQKKKNQNEPRAMKGRQQVSTSKPRQQQGGKRERPRPLGGGWAG